jgi:hypothetical protein
VEQGGIQTVDKVRSRCPTVMVEIRFLSVETQGVAYTAAE